MACKHGVKLPRGLKCDRGYLFLTVEHDGKLVKHPGCGPHTRAAEIYAKERLAKIRADIEKGRFGIEPEIPRKKFAQVVPIFLEYWAKERNERTGRPRHNEKAVKECRLAIERNLIPYFGDLWFDEITAAHVERRRNKRIQGVRDPKDSSQWLVPPVLGTTVNREHAPLGSIFTKIAKLMEIEEIEKFMIPAKNPCEAATKAQVRVHERELSDYEIKKLYLACRTLQDFDGWKICDLMLKSALSVADLRQLEIGKMIDMDRCKTQMPIAIPITLLQGLNWTNWVTRWKKIRKEAGFSIVKNDPQYVDAKVLRKTGINKVRRALGIKAAQQYAAHASEATTRRHYTIEDRLAENKPAAEVLTSWIDGLVKENGGDGGI